MYLCSSSHNITQKSVCTLWPNAIISTAFNFVYNLFLYSYFVSELSGCSLAHTHTYIQMICKKIESQLAKIIQQTTSRLAWSENVTLQQQDSNSAAKFSVCNEKLCIYKVYVELYERKKQQISKNVNRDRVVESCGLQDFIQPYLF